MAEMSIKKLVGKTIVRVFVIMVVIAIMNTLLKSPVITNEMALGQMDILNEGFVFWELFKSLRPVANFVLGAIGGLMVFGVYKDVYAYFAAHTVRNTILAILTVRVENTGTEKFLKKLNPRQLRRRTI